MKLCRTNRIIRTVCFVIILLAFILLLSTLQQGRKRAASRWVVRRDVQHMPEIIQFNHLLNDEAPPDGQGVVWRHAPGFIPLQRVQERHLTGGGDLPQSYRGKGGLETTVDIVRHEYETEGHVRHKNNAFTKGKKPTNTIIIDGTYPSHRNIGAKNRNIKVKKVTSHAKDGKDTNGITDIVNDDKNAQNLEIGNKVVQEKNNYNSEIDLDLSKDILKHVPPTTKSHERASKSCHEVAPKRYSFYTESDLLCLKEDKTVYFRSLEGVVCLIEGTDFAATNRKNNKECVCRSGWFGQECSMPQLIFKSEYPYHYGVAVREINRRIIYAMPVNHEFGLVEVKVNELASVVDVFVVLESNVTAAGQPKRTLLLDKLKQGFLRDFHPKILYLQLTHFPREARGDGWVMDSLLRNHIGDVILQRDVIRDVRQDDVMIMHDADELPVREALLFLKIHDGYPEPFGFIMKHRVFGFFWRTQDDTTNNYGGATIKYIRYILRNETYLLRNPGRVLGGDPGLVGRYRHDHSGRIHAWSAGTRDLPAGWHCSWCFNVQGLRYKMLAAHVSDTPRWGSFNNLTGLGYLNSLIATGHWFDNKTTYIRTNYTLEGAAFAPKYLLRNYGRYRHLLDIDAAVKHRSEDANLLLDNKIT